MSGYEGLGPLLSGVGVILGVIVAVLTLFRVNIHTGNMQWVESFRRLYESFWNDDEMAAVRLMLVNDTAYEETKMVLAKRNGSAKNTLTAAENVLLERVDRFCALMVQISLFASLSRRPWQRRLYDATFSFWIDHIKERHDLAGYIGNNWSSLYAQLPRG